MITHLKIFHLIRRLVIEGKKSTEQSRVLDLEHK